MVEPFVTTIKIHLPKLPLTEELLSTRAARLALAAQLEAAMNEHATFSGGGTEPTQGLMWAAGLGTMGLVALVVLLVVANRPRVSRKISGQ